MKEPREPDEMSFWEHLEALRMTLFACIAAFAVAATASLIFYKEIFALLRLPLERAAAGTAFAADAETALAAMRFSDPFSILLNIALLGGVVLAGPFALWKIAGFVAPALTARERRRLVPLCAASLGLFAAGAALAFFVLAPLSIRFMYFFSEQMGLRVNWLAADYYGFVVLLVLFVGALFEFPLLVVALQYLELVSTSALLRGWRWVAAGILVLTAFVSPTGDPVAVLALAGTLFALYLGAVCVGDFLLKRKLAAEARESSATPTEDAAAAAPAGEDLHIL